MRPLYFMPARRWQSWRWCLTVSTVSSFLVRLIAERIVVRRRRRAEGKREEGRDGGFRTWDFRDRVWEGEESGGFEEGKVKRVASMVKDERKRDGEICLLLSYLLGPGLSSKSKRKKKRCT